jgi:intermediate cleaving peptidase 55
LYTAVYNVQKGVLEMAKTGKDYSLLDLHMAAYHLTIAELARLGFKHPEKCVDHLFPHSIGHHLGMDLHDCPSVPFEAKLRPGMVFTVEPGLYVPDSLEYPERLRGVGVRIEDDVVVGVDGGAEVLTEAAPKDPSVLFGGSKL